MNNSELNEQDISDIPVSATLKVERPCRYGSVPGLSDDELADPRELERIAFLKFWEPILTLPIKPRRSWLRPAFDESGRVDWGAFDTVDFERIYGPFRRARHRAEQLRERLDDLIIMLSIVKDRVARQDRYLVIKQLRMGYTRFEHIADDDMRAFAEIYLKADLLKKEIAEIEESRSKRQPLACR
ncbi:MAG TPA: hypothetical protein PK093_05505 [Phycisphaerae bacterium]|nr:hypothetical protein [Phycisphaerae bacterium]